jgi:hypothetical protein
VGQLRESRRLAVAAMRIPQGGKDTMGLADGDGRIGQMVEDVDRDGGVEGVGGDRESVGVGLDHRWRMAPQHGPGGVQPDDP